MLRSSDRALHNPDLLDRLYSTIWNVAHQSQIQQGSFFDCKRLSELAASDTDVYLLMRWYDWNQGYSQFVQRSTVQMIVGREKL